MDKRPPFGNVYIDLDRNKNVVTLSHFTVNVNMILMRKVTENKVKTTNVMS